ncbi:MAG: ATP-binding protein [Cyanobacteria bacterium]|nr:ATP-binding protein [Cyanobacteriota bacterium]
MVEAPGSGIVTSIELLFPPFVQTQAEQQSLQGTGLELPISQKFTPSLSFAPTFEKAQRG